MAEASNAFEEWSTTACRRLDELERVHASAIGAAPGRRWQSRELIKSMFVALLAQFQAYCRSLHDETVDAFAGAGRSPQELVLRELLTRARLLDRGNPRRSALGSDFDRFGIYLVPALKGKRARSSADLDTLDAVADLRNAIVHGDDAGISVALAENGIGLTLKSFRRSRAALQRIVRDLDSVIAVEVSDVLGVALVWQRGGT